METEHNFVQLAKVQLKQETLYCGGLDPHPFGSLEGNLQIYNSVIPKIGKWHDLYSENTLAYIGICQLIPGMKGEQTFQFAQLLASVETYICLVVDILVRQCNVRVFKPQSAFYEQFGFAGVFMLSRVRQFIKKLEEELSFRLICLLDCKRGDILTTQAAYFTGLLGNLQTGWGIDYSPFDFDIINVTPWMGEDVMVFQDGDKEALGLKLMREGKGIIVVNKSSNPSGSRYQELYVSSKSDTVQMYNVREMKKYSDHYGLEHDGLSSIGLVVGSTHVCEGIIRREFPSTTLLVPGFGAQGGKFSYIIKELIHTGKYSGLGAIFSSSRGTMYPFMEKYGGSGKPENLQSDLERAVVKFRENERKAYEEANIEYPFAA